MMSRRKEELIKYVNLLMNLKENGFKCDNELGQAVKELHTIMLTNKSFRKIVVFEQNFNGVVDSVALFEDVMYDVVTVSRVHDDIVLGSGNTRIEIYKVSDDEKVNDRRFKGLSADYIINNTGIPNIEKQLGITLKSNLEK